MKRFSNEILNIDRNQLLAFHAWHLKVIIVLSNHKDGLTSKELCVYLGESRSVYRALSELKKEGWVIEQDGVCLFHCQKWFDYCQNLEKEKQIKENLIKEHDRESNKEKGKENISKEELIKEKAVCITFSNARDNRGAIKKNYFSWLTDSETTMRELCDLNKITLKDPDDPASLIDTLSPFINTFIQQLLAKGKDTFSRTEIKEYFYNWLKKVRDSEIKKERAKRRAKREAKKRQKEAQQRAEQMRLERIARQNSQFLPSEFDAYESWWDDLAFSEGVLPDWPIPVSAVPPQPVSAVSPPRWQQPSVNVVGIPQPISYEGDLRF